MALTKTTSVVTVDAWQAVTAGTLVVGADGDISASYDTLLYIQVALVEAVAQAGCTVMVEVSYTGNDWIKLTEFTGTAETPATTTINDAAVTAADTAITLTDATTGDFDVPGRLWYIKDGTIANSEAVRTKVNATHTVTLCDAILRSHADSLNVYDRVDEWVVQIPFAASFVRTLINNTDADADVDFTTRVSKVTAIS
ncbi:hypothetical protein KKF61_07625 [Patescibacteria group bacterium]|nr:hypothetical protein [Patescibacteria group bacterium]